MQFQLVELDPDGRALSAINVGSIEIIPPGGQLLFVLPPETIDMDFQIIKEEIKKHFGERRKHTVLRAGDLGIYNLADDVEQKDATDG